MFRKGRQKSESDDIRVNHSRGIRAASRYTPQRLTELLMKDVVHQEKASKTPSGFDGTAA